MGAWGAAGLLAAWLASAMADDARSGTGLEAGPGRRPVTARPGVREGARRRPPATSRRRTRRTARAAAREADRARRAGRSLDPPPAGTDQRTRPVRDDRAAANALPGAHPPSSSAGTRLPPGVIPAGSSSTGVERPPVVRDGAIAPARPTPPPP